MLSAISNYSPSFRQAYEISVPKRVFDQPDNLGECVKEFNAELVKSSGEEEKKSSSDSLYEAAQKIKSVVYPEKSSNKDYHTFLVLTGEEKIMAITHLYKLEGNKVKLNVPDKLTEDDKKRYIRDTLHQILSGKNIKEYTINNLNGLKGLKLDYNS